MSTIEKKRKICLNLAQLKFCIDKKLICKDYKYDWILKKLCCVENRLEVSKNVILTNSPQIGWSALYLALINEDLDCFNLLLEHGADFTAASENDSTILHLAIEQIYNNASDVELFQAKFVMEFVNSVLSAHVEHKIFINPTNQNRFSHFHAACMMNHSTLVKLFLINGVNIHRATRKSSPHFPGYTPLHFAAQFFALETVEILLEFGADAHVKNAKGSTPLQLLVGKSLECIQGVGKMESRSDKKLRLSIAEKIMKLLLQNSDENDVIITSNNGLTDLNCFLSVDDPQLIKSYSSNMKFEHCVNAKSPLFAGYTAFYLAAHLNPRTAKMRNVASMEAKDARGLTTFDICLEMYGLPLVCQILSIHPVWKNIVFGRSTTNLLNLGSPSTPVMLVDFVSAMSDIDRLAALLETNGVDANMRIPMESSLWPGYTPLHIAVALSSDSIEETTAILNQLYKSGANLNCQDIRGRTALHIAFREGKFEIAELLLSLCRQCEPINISDDENLTHLHILCYVAISEDSAHKLMLSILGRGVDVDVAYEGESAVFCVDPGSSALHVAMKTSCNWDYIPQVLLEHGANVMARDSNGMTPIHLALARRVEDAEFAEKILSTASPQDCVADNFNLSHLHVACYSNNLAAVEELIKQGADVNKAITCQTKNESTTYLQKFVGFTPLRFAVMNDNRSIAIALVLRDADILAKEPNGMTPLYAALKEDSKNILGSLEDKPNVFLFVLTRKRSWQERMLIKDGITMLHIAVCCSDIKIMISLLDKGAVNEQVFWCSPIWPGFTPLHVLATYDEQRHSKHANLDDEGTPGEILILKLLLISNADVTLSNSARDTPLHIIAKQWTINGDNTICTLHKRTWLRMLLQAHENFDVNPTNAQGLSFFHLACALGEVNVVKRFLGHGQVRVNKRIYYFSEMAPGCTPLHLAMRVKNTRRSDMQSQLEVVDLLLKHGANANAEDICGNTPLHEALNNYNSLCEDFVERIIRGGGDIKKRNIKGETALEIFLKLEKVEVEKVKYLLKAGCSFNTTNPLSGKNLWELALSTMTSEAVEELIFMTSLSFPECFAADEEGRDIIHQIVSIHAASQWEYDECIWYRQLIERILDKCDVDDQDKFGRTPLHLAAKHFNNHAISVLLDAGADINILDSWGQTALSSAFENNEVKMGKPVYSTAELLAMHVDRMLFCGVWVNRMNRQAAEKICDKLRIKPAIHEAFQKDLMEISKVQLGVGLWTLGDFLHEEGILPHYHTMLERDWDIIDEFFTEKNWYVYRTSNMAAKFILIQYRKANVKIEMYRQDD